MKYLPIMLSFIFLSMNQSKGPITVKELNFNIHDIHQDPSISYQVFFQEKGICKILIINNESKKSITRSSPYMCLFLYDQVTETFDILSRWDHLKVNKNTNAYVTFSALGTERKLSVELPLLDSLNENQIQYKPILDWIGLLQNSFVSPHYKEFLEKTR